MDRGSLIKGTVLAVMLSTGLTAAVAGVGAGTAAAATLQDQQLQLGLANESFHVDYNAQPDGDGHTRITGYVYSSRRRAVNDVQLRIAELDASGQLVATYFKTMLEEVPSGGRAYFDVKVPTNGNASTYQVGVYAWNQIEGGGV